MKKGKAPGSDEISTELLMLGGEECVRWLKIVFDSIWQHEAIPNDWKNQIIVLCTRRVVVHYVITIVALPC